MPTAEQPALVARDVKLTNGSRVHEVTYFRKNPKCLFQEVVILEAHPLMEATTRVVLHPCPGRKKLKNAPSCSRTMHVIGLLLKSRPFSVILGVHENKYI